MSTEPHVICPRNRDDCEPLSQVIAENASSFICCGCGNVDTRKIPKDKFRFCWKNKNVDQRDDLSERDVKDTLSVLALALSIDSNIRNNQND